MSVDAAVHRTATRRGERTHEPLMGGANLPAARKEKSKVYPASKIGLIFLQAYYWRFVNLG